MYIFTPDFLIPDHCPDVYFTSSLGCLIGISSWYVWKELRAFHLEAHSSGNLSHFSQWESCSSSSQAKDLGAVPPSSVYLLSSSQSTSKTWKV